MSNKSVFITGASRGIGKSVATVFAKNGYNIGINSRNSPQELHDLADELTSAYGITCIPFSGDAGDISFMEDTFREIEKRFHGIDVLINNAGISYMGLLSDMSILEWDQVIRTNLTSVFCCCKCAIPMMVRKKSGKIINISSVWGQAGASCEVAYSATKGGMNAFTKALAKELAPSNIQVNAISCGVIDTQMNQNISQEDKATLMEEIPTGRFGTADEAADFVYTITNSNSYLTGQIIGFDGGWI